MLSKEFFLRVCRYANTNWKANLSETERVEQGSDNANVAVYRRC